MTWQDIIFGIGQWIFVIALVPSVLGKDKPALASSVLTGTVLAIFAVTYMTLSLWAAGVSTLLVAGMWYTLAIQKYLAGKKSKDERPSS